MNLPITDVPLPVRLRFDRPLTDEELLRFSEGNDVVWIEREADGTLYAKAVGDLVTSLRCGEVNFALMRWAERDGRGRCYGRAGWLLPDGSMRGARISWALDERMASLTKEQRKGFAPLAPDFVVEVLSPFFDDAAYLRSKMEQWVANGVQEAWLIEGDERRVTIYRPGREAEVLEAPEVLRGDGEVAGFEVGTERIWDVDFDDPLRSPR